MKVKSLAKVIESSTNVYLYRNIVKDTEILDVDMVYKGTFDKMTDKELRCWTDEVSIDMEEKCLAIRLGDKEVQDGEVKSESVKGL